MLPPFRIRKRLSASIEPSHHTSTGQGAHHLLQELFRYIRQNVGSPTLQPTSQVRDIKVPETPPLHRRHQREPTRIAGDHRVGRYIVLSRELYSHSAAKYSLRNGR